MQIRGEKKLYSIFGFLKLVIILFFLNMFVYYSLCPEVDHLGYSQFFTVQLRKKFNLSRQNETSLNTSTFGYLYTVIGEREKTIKMRSTQTEVKCNGTGLFFSLILLLFFLFLLFSFYYIYDGYHY
jgi:hypothetical protein